MFSASWSPSRTCVLWGILLHSWAIFFCLPEKTTSLSQSSPQLLSQPTICVVLMQPSHSCQGWDYKCTRYPALIWCQDLLAGLWKAFSLASSWSCCLSSQVFGITSLLFLSVSCWPVLIFWLFFEEENPYVMEWRWELWLLLYNAKDGSKPSVRWEGPNGFLCPSPWGLCFSAALRGSAAHWQGLFFPDPEMPLAPMARRSSKGKAVGLCLSCWGHPMIQWTLFITLHK